MTKYDRRTGQVSNVGPIGGRGGAASSPADLSRQVRTQPIVFSLVDNKSLFFATNVLWKTMDGGINWKQISPDLTRKTHEIPKSVGKYTEQVPGGEPGRRQRRARHLHDRPFVQGRQPHLGRAPTTA